MKTIKKTPKLKFTDKRKIRQQYVEIRSLGGNENVRNINN